MLPSAPQGVRSTTSYPHLLGGPDPDDRTALALATASRHPGVALLIPTGNFPNQKLVAPAMVLYLIVGAGACSRRRPPPREAATANVYAANVQ